MHACNACVYVCIINCYSNVYIFLLHICIYIGAVYFTLANIDPALRSKLEAINLLMLFPYTLLKTYTFDQILEPVVEELKVLSSVSFLVCMSIVTVHIAFYIMHTIVDVI